MRWIALAVALLAMPASAQNPAPFCVQTGAMTQCTYYSAEHCRSVARNMDGMCVPNQGGRPAQAQQFGPLDAMRYAMQGAEDGRRQGEAALAAKQRQQGSASSTVVYQCPGQDGLTLVPAKGCIVFDILKPL